MIDLQLYRIRIGQNQNYGGGKNNNNNNIFNLRHMSDTNLFEGSDIFCNPVNVIVCLLYMYFIIFVCLCSMSVVFSLSRKMAPCRIHISLHPRPSFRLCNITNIFIKNAFCLLFSYIFKSFQTKNARIRKYYLYKLLLGPNNLKSKYQLGRLTKISQSLFLWFAILNFLLITIVNPALHNPGPRRNNSVKSKGRPLTVFYNNVQGLINANELGSNSPPLNMTKIHELHGYIFTHKPDIIILNETWLKKSILDTEILPDVYKTIRVDRSGETHPWDPGNPKKFRKNGGGVLIAHRNDIEIESTRVGVIKVQAEILTLNLKLPSDKKLTLSTLYRVGNLGIDNFEAVKKYFTTLASKKKLNKHVLIGDFNFPEIKWPDPLTSVDLHKKFLDFLMVDLAHSQLITESTHKSGNTLDLLFTNIPEIIKNISVLGRNEACLSDHSGITFEIKIDVSLKKTVKRKVFNYSKANWKDLNFDLKRIDWVTLIGSCDPHVSWIIFKNILNALSEKHIPKMSLTNQFQAPWYDSECDKLLRKKEKCRKKANSPSGTEVDHNNFRNYRRDFRKLMNKKMRLNIEDDNDPSLISKKFHKHVKSKSKSTRIPETVWYKNKFRNKLADQADLFNNFFYEQFSDSSKYDINIDMKNDKFGDLKFHELDTLLLLRDINPAKAAGPDGFHGTLLKNCASSLAKPLTILFNVSYVTGCIPDDWKLASIVPVHKKGDKGSVENYRPISLTSLFMKIFEKCITNQLFAACEDLLDPRQHGFLKSKSCTTQMIPFTYDLALTLNNKSKTDIVYFDFAKAFDSVSHDLILKKLKNDFNVDGIMLRFIKSFLQGRQQQVVIGGLTSPALPVKSGVPQGSILGPLLFVIFVNDMFACVSEGTNIALYADDTKIWREIHSSIDHFILQDDIDKLSQWSIINKMKFHHSKCKVLSVSNQRNILHNLPFTIFQYKLGDKYIEYVNSHNDLGVSVNEKLTWTEQCNKLISQANSKLGLLMRTCHFTMNKSQKRAFYLSVVRSIFEHCSIIWHPTSSNQISMFEAIQKKAVKWIEGRRHDHYSDTEFFEKQKQLDILPIKFKFVLNDLILYYKIIKSLVYIKFPDHFSFLKADQAICTRESSVLVNKTVRVEKLVTDKIAVIDTTRMTCAIRPDCDSFKNCYFYRTMTLWNKLPCSIRQSLTISKFKSELIKFLWLADLHWPD